ncbi:hypothetical protein ABZ468_07570 [Streptomyces sp. NPDC005708]|uniref:hypothetical protein n=1 Tax=Streptomyces sp. NPDC005708 TaxID=3154564 RepID=UPI0033E3F856
MSTQPSTDARAIVRALEGMTRQFARVATALETATQQLQRVADVLETPPGEDIAEVTSVRPLGDVSGPLWIGPDGDPMRRCGNAYATELDGVAKCHRGFDHLGAHRGFSAAGREYTWPNQGERPRTS